MAKTETPNSVANDFLDQSQLHALSEKVMDRFEDLLDHFGIELAYSSKKYYGCCPIHGGDKHNAFNLFHDGDTYRGNWRCFTMQCESHFKSSVIGFVRGVLSRKEKGWENPGDETISFADTIKFLLDFLKTDKEDLLQKTSSDKHKFITQTKYIKSQQPVKTNRGVERGTIRKALTIPASYYTNRGYTTKILDDYDVGVCTNPKKPMFNRVVVPIYDTDYKFMVGCTGRSIFEQCPKCHRWHNPSDNCPDDKYKNLPEYAKWRHSQGFAGESYLYNFWQAKKHILDSKVAILVESPGNVWRLEEAGIHNSVAMFGVDLSDGQQVLLDTSGALAIIVLTDNDEAGNIARETIRKKCERMYYVHCIKPTANDVGDMTIDQINTQIQPLIQKVIESVKI